MDVEQVHVSIVGPGTVSIGWASESGRSDVVELLSTAGIGFCWIDRWGIGSKCSYYDMANMTIYNHDYYVYNMITYGSQCFCFLIFLDTQHYKDLLAFP
jgi:hypothetical protein